MTISKPKLTEAHHEHVSTEILRNGEKWEGSTPSHRKRRRQKAKQLGVILGEWLTFPSIPARIVLTIGFVVIALRGRPNNSTVGGDASPTPHTLVVFVKLPFIHFFTSLLMESPWRVPGVFQHRKRAKKGRDEQCIRPTYRLY